MKARNVRHAAIVLACVLIYTADTPAAERNAQFTATLERAVQQLNDDPLLGQGKTVRTLSWNDAQKDPPKPKTAIPQWLRALRKWMNEGSRVLVWVLGALGALWLLWKLREVMRARYNEAAPTDFKTASHIRDLDIRPESLPPDVGAAALALWRVGDAAGALSLLYRGALSRLVHGHRVPVHASNTEGECVHLASIHLQADSARFFADVVGAWQRAVYARRAPTDELMMQLCGSFSAMLDPPAPSSRDAT